MRNLEISPYSYSGCGFANETFPNLSWWMNVFAFYLNMYVPLFLFACAGLVRTNGYLVFDIIQYCKDMFIWRYRTCCTAALTCRNWSIIMNADTNTVRILINTCLWDDNSFNKAIFQARSDWVMLNWHYMAINNKFLPSFKAFFAEFNSAYLSILFRIILYIHF